MSSAVPQPADLLEAWGDVVPTYDSDWVGDAAGAYGLMTRYQRPATTLHDRSDGRYLPVYQTEFDLAVVRALGRTLAVMAPGLVGGLRNLCNYTIGEGYTFTVTKEANADTSDDAVEPLITAVQSEINQLLDNNEFTSGLDREIHDTSIVDGECFLYLKMVEEAVRIVRCEPDQIRQPANSRELEEWIQQTLGIPCDSFVSSWSFGIHTRADLPDTPLGYHVVADESGVDWEYVPADRMVHIKRNVTRNAKRGFSDFYPIEADSTRGEKLRRNMAEGAAVQSAIAFVRQHVAGTTRTGVEQMLGDNRVGMSPQSVNGGSRPRNVVQYRPGTVVDLSAGLEYKPGPLGSERASDFLLVAAYVQRMQAVRWSMPEYMFSGDASNANYASTMEATAPFVKSCEAEQRFYSRHFVSLLWKALKLRWELGAFDHLNVCWECLEGWLKIKAECPEVATRDELQNVQRQEILIRLGILSRKTAAAQNGLDYEAEVANGAKPEGEEAGAATGGAPGNGPGNGPTQSEQPSDAKAGSPPDDLNAALAEENLFECGGKGGKPGPCPENKADVPSTHHSANRGLSSNAGSTGEGMTAAGKLPSPHMTQPKPTSGKLASPSPPKEAADKSGRGKDKAATKKKPANARDSNQPSQPKRTEAPAPKTESATKAAKNTKPNTAERQQYAHKSARVVARGVGGSVVPDNAPADIRVVKGDQVHFIELKTMLDRKTNDVHMSHAAVERKARVTADTGHEFHTVVRDRRNKFSVDSNGMFEHPLYYKRGAGSCRLDQMVKVTSLQHLHELMNTPEHLLEGNARPHPKWANHIEEARRDPNRGALKSAAAKKHQDEANIKPGKQSHGKTKPADPKSKQKSSQKSPPAGKAGKKPLQKPKKGRRK